MKPWSALLAVAVLLAGCAGTQPTRSPLRDDIGDFVLEARFALRVTPAGEAPHSSNGRLTWTHQGNDDRILLASPLGNAVAEIETQAGLSRLRTAEGRQLESSDPDTLIEEVTGQRLPVARLPAWLLGRPGREARVEHDPLGRPQRLFEAGWQVDYTYDDDRPTAPPARLTVSRDNDVELRLRIEEWKDAP